MDDHTDQVDNKTDAEVMLPGFRFHPTDEELVGFYLKKKIQHRVLPIELIKQVDIYKHDPWDLPNLAPSGEKEWYFYCPRDRKYKNSTRPNRVTGSGFWKATGTDRPIYSSDNGQCIGLKKSLVFYRGRAAKGIKTDWMMHEFRLPNSHLVEPAADQSNKKIQDHKNLPPNDAWAICRIFKKTSSVAQRAISHSWELSSLTQDHRTSDFFAAHSNQFDQPAVVSTDRFETPSLSYRSLNQSAAYKLPSSNSNSPFPFMDFTNNGLTVFSSTTTDSSADPRPVLNLVEDASKNCVSVGGFGGGEQLQPLIDNNFPMNQYYRENEVGFPLSLAAIVADEWKLNMAWDSPPACHSESTTYSTK